MTTEPYIETVMSPPSYESDPLAWLRAKFPRWEIEMEPPGGFYSMGGLRAHFPEGNDGSGYSTAIPLTHKSSVVRLALDLGQIERSHDRQVRKIEREYEPPFPLTERVP